MMYERAVLYNNEGVFWYEIVASFVFLISKRILYVPYRKLRSFLKYHSKVDMVISFIFLDRSLYFEPDSSVLFLWLTM